ncbi:DoxX family protein [Mycobacterium kyogaense]|uniref:DoxX family protein n=1 Tax=Mycobacterium kyogaense TaxID=2212479 RepID=UPI001F090319|nr:DoxX family protein [Mycobacterium kyogaense]
MTFSAIDRALDTRLSPLTSYALAVFRIVFALLLICHGTTALFGWPAGEAAQFGVWPYWYAGVIELVCGVLMAVGALTRPAAFLASGTMAFAYFMGHAGISFWPAVNQGEPAVMNCFAFLLLVFTGPGALAIDTGRSIR